MRLLGLCAAFVVATGAGGCVSVADRATSVTVTYEVRNHGPGGELELSEQHEFSGHWTSWTDVTLAGGNIGAGPQETVYKDGLLSSDGQPPHRVGDPHDSFNPGPLFNREHGELSGDEQLTDDDVTSPQLRRLRDRVAGRLGLEPEALRAMRVEESGVCDKTLPNCVNGVLTEVTTAVVRRDDAVPLYVRRLDNGIVNAEMEVTSIE